MNFDLIKCFKVNEIKDDNFNEALSSHSLFPKQWFQHQRNAPLPPNFRNPKIYSLIFRYLCVEVDESDLNIKLWVKKQFNIFKWKTSVSIRELGI